jgi:hypothetical protein
MDEIPLALLVALLALVGVVFQSVYTTASNNRARETQQKHDLDLKRLEVQNEKGLRLWEEKRTAYSNLMREVSLANSRMEQDFEEKRLAGQTSMTHYSTELASAKAEARLLMSLQRWPEFDRILNEFRDSHMRDLPKTLDELGKLLADDLAA